MKGIMICGPTASGKTTWAVEFAGQLKSTVFGADSRQIYQQLDMGSGKDLDDFFWKGTPVPYRLIDSLEVGIPLDIALYQQCMQKALHDFQGTPVVCGGSSLYLQQWIEPAVSTCVLENAQWRKDAHNWTTQALRDFVIREKGLWPWEFDLSSRKRLVRAVEIIRYIQEKGALSVPENLWKGGMEIFATNPEVEDRRSNISKRLVQRMELGMLEEVEKLLAAHVNPEFLIHLGLEYKWLTWIVLGKMTKKEGLLKLETDIHRYAKRQMTWLRSWEKKGVSIQWLPENEDRESFVQGQLKRLKLEGAIEG